MNKNLAFSLLFLVIQSNSLFGQTPSDYKFIKPNFKPISILPSQVMKRCSLLPFNAPASTVNWAGYVASTNIFNPTKGTVSFIEGTWTIPTIAKGSAKPNTFYAIWVGIDGFNNGTIEQLGTAYQFVNGRQINYAWFEMFPKVSMQISNFPVSPGESITASVKYQGNGQYQLRMQNNTKKTYTIIPAAMTRSTTSPRTSCEWIVEAPSDNNGILPLAHFNPSTFTNCKATIKGVTGTIKNSHYQNIQLNMATSNGTLKAVTTTLNSTSNSFKTTWKHS